MSFPRKLKLIINMHDSLKDKYLVKKDKAKDIRHINREIKYTMATSPTKCVLFDPNVHKKMEQLFFKRGNLNKKTKTELRKDMNSINANFIKVREKNIESLEEEKEKFKIFSEELSRKNKNKEFMEDYENVESHLTEISDAIKLIKNPIPIAESKKKKIIKGKMETITIPAKPIETVILENKTSLTSNYNSIWKRFMGFFTYIRLTEMYEHKTINEDNCIIECERMMDNYNLLKQGTLEGILAFSEIDAKILKQHHEIRDINTVVLVDYTFKTITDKQCIQDKLMSFIEGNVDDEYLDTNKIYYYGFNIIPEMNERSDEDRFIEFFRNFVADKQRTLPRDVDADDYLRILSQLDESPTMPNLMDIVLSNYDIVDSYPFNIEKRPDCLFGTLMYEYLKSLVVAKNDGELMRIFAELFTLDHPGNRMKTGTTNEEYFEGIYYDSVFKKGNKTYEIDKSELLFLLGSLCDDLDVLDNGCKNGEDLILCETGYDETPEGSPLDKTPEGSPLDKTTVEPLNKRSKTKKKQKKHKKRNTKSKIIE